MQLWISCVSPALASVILSAVSVRSARRECPNCEVSGSSCITGTRRKPKPRDLIGTARCGPARRVVWEG